MQHRDHLYGNSHKELDLKSKQPRRRRTSCWARRCCCWGRGTAEQLLLPLGVGVGAGASSREGRRVLGGGAVVGLGGGGLVLGAKGEA